jgi:hypothetical protein
MNEHLHPMFKGILNTTYEAMRLPKQPPMGQFEIIDGVLCVADYTRYDLFYGFRRGLRDLRKGNQA